MQVGVKRPRSEFTDVEWLQRVNRCCIHRDQDGLKDLLSLRSRSVLGNLLEKPQPLYVAAKHNNTTAVVDLLSWGAPPNHTNSQGVSPLYIACHYGYTRIVRVLCEGGADVGVRKKDGASAIHSAVKHGHIHALKVLIEHRAQVKEEVVKGMTLLHTAAQHGRHEILAFLLDTIKMDINCLSTSGYSSVQMSCFRRHKDVLFVLMSRKATLAHRKEGCKWPEVHICAHLGDAALLTNLIKNIIKFYPEQDVKELLNYCRGDGMTPLMVCAAAKSNIEVAKVLMEYGASPLTGAQLGEHALLYSIRHDYLELTEYIISQLTPDVLRLYSGRGWNSFHNACRFASVAGVTLLLKLVPELLYTKTNNGLNGLYIACKFGRVETVELLVNKYKLPIDEQVVNNSTPLYTAAKHNRTNVVKFLIESGANWRLVNGRGCSPFLTACNHNNLSVVKLMVKLIGSSVVASVGRANWSGVHIAARLGRMELLKYICTHLRAIDIPVGSLLVADEGYSALDIAAFHGKLKVIRYLVAYEGMDPNPADRAEGRSPIDLALKTNEHETVMWLKAASEWNKVETLTELRDSLNIQALFLEGRQGVDPFRKHDTNLDRDTAMVIATRGPSMGTPWLPVCPTTTKLIDLLSQPLNQSNIMYYPKSVRETVLAVLITLKQSSNLPLQLQWMVCGFLGQWG